MPRKMLDTMDAIICPLNLLGDDSDRKSMQDAVPEPRPQPEINLPMYK